jgi:hypothetical protein
MAAIVVGLCGGRLRQYRSASYGTLSAVIRLRGIERQQRINADRAQWVTLAHGLHGEAFSALKAIDAKNVPALFDAGNKLDGARERAVPSEVLVPAGCQPLGAVAVKVNWTR